MRTVRECVDRMLVIFPFEEPFYSAAGVSVTFVGHPLVELARPAPDPQAFLSAQGLDPARPVLAVLPGSRRQEISYNLPPIAGALRILRSRRPELQPARRGWDWARSFGAALQGLPVTLVRGRRLLMSAARGIIASGTATVERPCSTSRASWSTACHP
jgi:lipid-A-disaccharide synthase